MQSTQSSERPGGLASWVSAVPRDSPSFDLNVDEARLTEHCQLLQCPKRAALGTRLLRLGVLAIGAPETFVLRIVDDEQICSIVKHCWGG